MQQRPRGLQIRIKQNAKEAKVACFYSYLISKKNKNEMTSKCSHSNKNQKTQRQKSYEEKDKCNRGKSCATPLLLRCWQQGTRAIAQAHNRAKVIFIFLFF